MFNDRMLSEKFYTFLHAFNLGLCPCMLTKLTFISSKGKFNDPKWNCGLGDSSYCLQVVKTIVYMFIGIAKMPFLLTCTV